MLWVGHFYLGHICSLLSFFMVNKYLGKPKN
jgi:hypothetical protein